MGNTLLSDRPTGTKNPASRAGFFRSRWLKPDYPTFEPTARTNTAASLRPCWQEEVSISFMLSTITGRLTGFNLHGPPAGRVANPAPVCWLGCTDHIGFLTLSMKLRLSRLRLSYTGKACHHAAIRRSGRMMQTGLENPESSKNCQKRKNWTAEKPASDSGSAKNPAL